MPVDPPVTATVALVAFAANVTFAGTMATPGFVELRLTFKPKAGAGADNCSVTF